MKPTCARVLAKLQATPAQWVRGIDLAAPDCGGLRFGGRIHELRRMDYDIEDRADPRGRTRVHEYRWLPPDEQEVLFLDLPERVA